MRTPTSTLKFSALIILFAAIPLSLGQSPTDDDPCTPKQVHISLGNAYYLSAAADPTGLRNNTMFVIFHTKDKCTDAVIRLFSDGGIYIDVQATSVNIYQEKNDTYSYSTYIHTFELFDLLPQKLYKYSALKNKDDTNPRNFTLFAPSVGPTTTVKENENPVTRPHTFFFWGDFDNTTFGLPAKAQAKRELARLGTEFTSLVLLGDYAYDLESNNGTIGDVFMEEYEDIFATTPMIAVQGNHENKKDFANYNARFRMPAYDRTTNHIYSANLGPVHWVSFNIDRYILLNETARKDMLTALESDLKYADRDEQRQIRPWIIYFAHQPWYASSPYSNANQIYRDFSEDLENLMDKYNVDLVLNGHVHCFERMLPLRRNKTTYSGENKNNFTNAKSTIYITEGVFGSNHWIEQIDYKARDYTAAIGNDTGFGVLRVTDKMSLSFQHMAFDGRITDYFNISKTSLRPFHENPIEVATKIILIMAGFVLMLIFLVIGLIVHEVIRQNKTVESKLISKQINNSYDLNKSAESPADTSGNNITRESA